MERIWFIALNTYRESVRSKLLFSILFFMVALVAVSAMFGSVTIGDHVKVIKDFGLFSLSFFSVTYAVITGAALLFKELSRKTIFNILAKSVSRGEFLCGKYLGMLMTIGYILILMCILLMLFIYCFSFEVDYLILLAALQIFFQLVIICAYTILFSTIMVTPMLSGALTFGLFLAGRSSEYVLYFIQSGDVKGGGAEVLLKGLYWLIPHLDHMDVSDRVVYGDSISPGLVLWSLSYAVSYALVLLLISSFFFRNKEFK